MTSPTRIRASLPHFLLSVSVLATSLVPLTGRAKTIRDSLRSLEPNRVEREASSAGYYEGLISTEAGQGSRSELSLRLLGKPTEWVRFQAAAVSRQLKGDFLAFELRANVSETLFGHDFTTNSHGLRDREYALEKPTNTIRVALLGSSIDMGWGVGTDDTYANLLEDWLNRHAARYGLVHRYEVLNFAVAAYAPTQRLESFLRKATRFDPDVLIYSATMLDPRLMEIHVGHLLQHRIDLKYPALRSAIAASGLTDADLRVDSSGEFLDRNIVKQRIGRVFWQLQDAVIGELAAECRSRGITPALVVIPRAGKSDTPSSRAIPCALHRGVASRHGLPTIDVADAFDHLDASSVEISAWDDHPNTLGHERIFLGVARGLAADPHLAEALRLGGTARLNSHPD
ncbi:MAG: SGNH/GDSL hydrolase family protein [Isosphaeraceae bacterium]|nr:SGNH/GDSL hydrolase family protein [Isosphaeraceae bacterium]